MQSKMVLLPGDEYPLVGHRVHVANYSAPTMHRGAKESVLDVAISAILSIHPSIRPSVRPSVQPTNHLDRQTADRGIVKIATLP
jgi:hypothetical protein